MKSGYKRPRTLVKFFNRYLDLKKDEKTIELFMFHQKELCD